MAGEDSSTGSLAKRYASALFDLADEQKKLDEIAGDLATLKAAVAQSSDLQVFLRSPLLGRDEQSRAMAALLDRAGAGDLTKRFVQVVAQNRRLFALTAIIEAYLAELARRRGEVTAEVTSAIGLSDDQQRALSAAIGECVGQSSGNKVHLDLKVDPSLLGGLVVKVGSRMFDSSLKSKLQRLQFVMKGVG